MQEGPAPTVGSCGLGLYRKASMDLCASPQAVFPMVSAYGLAGDSALAFHRCGL